MRKRIKTRKFGRVKSQKTALIKNLCAELFRYEQIQTTEAKAKELKRFAEKAITKAKKGDLTAKRELLKDFNEEITKKLILEIAPKYEERAGGYTKVIKLGSRALDGAKIAIIKLV